MQEKNLSYWKAALVNFKNVKMLAVAALVVSLRVVLRLVRIPVGPDIYISFDCFVNSIGSMIYGPLVALAVGAVSDTLGALLIPQGPYFLPFIVTEMSSSFIFALFLWRKERITPARIVLSRFTVNFVSNIIITSIIMKWLYYPLYFSDKVYPLFNSVRIAKNLILFPIEGLLMAILIYAAAPGLVRLGLMRKNAVEKLKVKDIVLIVILTLISVALVVSYVLWLAPYLEAHKITLL